MKEEATAKIITCSISVLLLVSISYIIRDPTRPLSLPQIILVQTNTMKVALNPKPMAVVTKLVPEPIISNLPLHKTNLQYPRKLKQRGQEAPGHI